MPVRLEHTTEPIERKSVIISREYNARRDLEDQYATIFADPLKFVAACWPEKSLYDKQAQLLLSVRDNKQTYSHAAHGMGKSHIAGIAALWWFCSRSPAKVVAISSSEKQLKNVLFSEIRKLLDTSKIKLPLDVTDLLVRKINPNPDSSEQYSPGEYIQGQVANKVESFQGHHLPNDRPRVLLIIEEASGVDDEFKTAGGTWAHHQLIIGNALNAVNFFYRDCKLGDAPDPSGEAKLLRKVIHIDGEDSPNVRLGKKLAAKGYKGPWPLLVPGVLSYPKYLQHLQEWDAIQIHTRLHGLFYEGMESLLYPMTWLDRGQSAWLELLKIAQQRRSVAMGIDVAMGGRDDTVWTVIGHDGIIEQIVLDTPNTMEIPGRTIRLMEQYKIHPGCVAIDLGGGKPIFDRLAELGHHILGVSFGSAAGTDAKTPEEAANLKKAYKNLRAEMYGVLREVLDPARNETPFAIPNLAHELRQELAILPLQYDSEGKLYLPPKDRDAKSAHSSSGKAKSIREMLGRSPDRADSLVLATYAWKRGATGTYAALTSTEQVKTIEQRTIEAAARLKAKLAAKGVI